MEQFEAPLEEAKENEITEESPAGKFTLKILLINLWLKRIRIYIR